MRARILTAALTAAATLLAGAGGATAASSAEGGRSLAWLSTGDSFSAGEGIIGAGTKYDGTDADLCAQSDLAYGPRALNLLTTQRNYTTETEEFTACTGFLTGDFYNLHEFEDKTTPRFGSLWDWTLNAQKAKGKGAAFDVITFSLGGNDVGFPELLADCTDAEVLVGPTPENWLETILDYGCPIPEVLLEDRIDEYLKGIPFDKTKPRFGPPGTTQWSLEDFYLDIAKKLRPDGIMVVAGYPRLIAESAQWPAWRGHHCGNVKAADADTLGAAAVYFDTKLRETVEAAGKKLDQLDGGRKIQYLSRLELFDERKATDEPPASGAPPRGRSLCTPTLSEWIVGFTLTGRDGSLRYQRSFHPNEAGHQRTAEALAEMVDEHFRTQSGATSTAPPIRDLAPRYEVGAPFDDMCDIAFPFPTTYTATSTVLTMFCQKSVYEYPLIQVTYDDPNLKIGQSTGFVRVRGTITDLARNTFGVKKLFIKATSIDVP